MLYLNADSGNATRFVHQRGGDRIHEVAVDGMDTLIEVAHTLAADDHGWDTVVFDPVSDAYRILLDETSERAIRPTLNHRGDVVVHLERFCRMLVDNPTVNTIIVAHELVLEGDGDQETRVVPFTGTGKPTLGLKIASMVDVVGYCARVENDKGEASYLAQLVQGKGRIAGDRFNDLGPVRELNLAEWFEAIHNKEKAS